MIGSGRPREFGVAFERIQAHDACSAIGVPPGQSTVTAAYLQNVRIAEVDEFVDGASLIGFGIDWIGHRLETGDISRYDS